MEFLYDLAIVAIIKDEGRYLAEWLDYHIAIGVEHFFLYDNGSKDNTREILAPYREWVTAIYVPGQKMQLPVYNMAIRDYAYCAKYLAIIDLDEFIYPVGGKDIHELLAEKLGDGNWSGLTANWVIFGSNGHRIRPEGGVLENYTKRGKEADHHVKSILNPRRVYNVDNPHRAMYYLRGAIDEDGRQMPEPFNEARPHREIQINHYATKSREEFIERRCRPRADYGTPYEDLEAVFAEADQNDVFDDGILKYYEKYKKIPRQPKNVFGYAKKLLLEEISPAIQGRETTVEEILNYVGIYETLAVKVIDVTNEEEVRSNLYNRLIQIFNAADRIYVEYFWQTLNLLPYFLKSSERERMQKFMLDSIKNAKHGCTFNMAEWHLLDFLERIL